MDPKIKVTNSIANVICALIFGKRFSLSDPKFIQLTGYFNDLPPGLAADVAIQAMPFLMWFPNAMRHQMTKSRRSWASLFAYLRERVTEHTATVDKQADAPDYLYAYQAESDRAAKSGEKSTFTGK